MKYDVTYAVEQLAVDLAGNDEVADQSGRGVQKLHAKSGKNTDGDRGCTCGL